MTGGARHGATWESPEGVQTGLRSNGAQAVRKVLRGASLVRIDDCVNVKEVAHVGHLYWRLNGDRFTNTYKRKFEASVALPSVR
jgi:hypothetical protein